jgi:flagellar motor switch protein FliM
VALIDFAIESLETEPQFLQIMAPNEAVVCIGIEVRIGGSAGMMNLAIPSITIKMMRQKFDQQWFVRRAESTEQEQSRILGLIKPATVDMDVRLNGPQLLVRDFMRLQAGDVLSLEYPAGRPVDLHCNGKLKFQGALTAAGRKRAFTVQSVAGMESVAGAML